MGLVGSKAEVGWGRPAVLGFAAGRQFEYNEMNLVDQKTVRRTGFTLIERNNSPSVRHGQSTSLSFADGHAERWKWLTLNKDQGYAASATTTQSDLTRVQNAIYTP